jgi:hypothetical protein
VEPAAGDRPVPRDIQFPKIELGQQKKPAPLLSRLRRRGPAESAEPGSRPRLAPAEKQAAPRQIASAASQGEASTTALSLPEMPVGRSGRITLWRRAAVYGTLLGGVLGLGWFAYYYLRETRVEGIVVAPGYQIQEVAVVSDFREEAVRTAQDLFYEREPLLKDIRERRDVVEGAKADIAGREERIRLLREQIDAANREVEAIIREAREASQRLWASAGIQLDEEYEQKLDEFRVRVENRARELNLPYDPASDIKSPDVWVNAFRLALYDAPPAVNGSDERVWVESILTEWKGWHKTWDARVAAVKQEVERIQASPKEQIDEINRRIANLNSRIDETRTEIEPVQKELEVNQKALDGLLSEDQALQAEYFQRLLKTPDGRTRFRVPFDTATGKFSWRHIEKTPFKPGQYLLWVKATKGDAESWSMISFPIVEYGTTVLRIEPGALVSVVDVLRAGSASAAKE